MISVRPLVDPSGQLNGLPSSQREALLKILGICFVISATLLVLSLPIIYDLYGTKEQLFGGDFLNYWTGSVLAQAGRIEEIFRPFVFHALQEEIFDSSFETHVWSYPPHMLLFVYPLGFMPYLAAYLFWTLAGLAVYLFATQGKNWRTLSALALLLAPATLENTLDGQVGFFTAALFVGGMTLVDRRPLLAGILFGCLTFKPHVGFLIPLALLSAGLWRPFLSATVTTVALIAVSIALFGWESWRAYFDVVTPFQMYLLEEGQGFYVYMMASPFMSARSLGLGPTVGYVIQIPFALAAAGLVHWAYRYHSDRGLQLQILIVATFLSNPYIFNYDMTLLSVAVVLACQRLLATGFHARDVWVLLAIWFLPLYLPLINYVYLPIAPLIIAAFALYAVKNLVNDSARGSARTALAGQSPDSVSP